MDKEAVTKYLQKFITANSPDVMEKFRHGEYEDVFEAAADAGLFKLGEEPSAEIDQLLMLWGRMNSKDRRFVALMVHDEMPPDLMDPDQFFSSSNTSSDEEADEEPGEEKSSDDDDDDEKSVDDLLAEFAADDDDTEVDPEEVTATKEDKEDQPAAGSGWDSLQEQLEEQPEPEEPLEEEQEAAKPAKKQKKKATEKPAEAKPQQDTPKVKRWVALEKKLANVKDLPTLPGVFTEVLRIAADPKSDIQSLQRVIVQDPTLSSTILRLANSAYYGIGKDISSLNMALVVIGFKEICNITTSLSVLKTFPKSKMGKVFDFDGYWVHSAAVAATSRVLAERFHSRWREEIYLAGLLHDIGVQFLATYFPQEMDDILTYTEDNNIPQWQAELKLYSTDHARVGAYLGGVWNLPKSLRMLIRYHHEVWRAGEYEYEAAVIHVANEFCHLDAEHNFHGFDPELLANHPAWKIVTDGKPISYDEINELLEKMQKEADLAKEFIMNTIAQS